MFNFKIGYKKILVAFAEPCVDFLKRQAAELDFEFKVEEPVTPKKPIVILTWIGTQPQLKSIVLNSHMDVVPVFEVSPKLNHHFGINF